MFSQLHYCSRGLSILHPPLATESLMPNFCWLIPTQNLLVEEKHSTEPVSSRYSQQPGVRALAWERRCDHQALGHLLCFPTCLNILKVLLLSSSILDIQHPIRFRCPSWWFCTFIHHETIPMIGPLTSGHAQSYYSITDYIPHDAHHILTTCWFYNERSLPLDPLHIFCLPTNLSSLW